MKKIRDFCNYLEKYHLEFQKIREMDKNQRLATFLFGTLFPYKIVSRHLEKFSIILLASDVLKEKNYQNATNHNL